MEQSLQERFAPTSVCFGCGPANERGLHIRSFPRDGIVVATWRAPSWTEAWPGSLSGGVTGTLLDCHSNWTAAWTLRERDGLEGVPFTVTARYEVKLLRPTPTAGPIELEARATEVEGNRVVVASELRADGKVRATFQGTFVSVPPGHPAHGRW
jgi:acyl-coenzyme A thioesterase PaaI-like protein